jgi:hypothetical protein
VKRAGFPARFFFDKKFRDTASELSKITIHSGSASSSLAEPTPGAARAIKTPLGETK